MVKIIEYICLFLCVATTAASQLSYSDSLRGILNKGTDDSTQIKLLYHLTQIYGETRPDSSVYFANELYQLAEKKGLRLVQAEATVFLGYGMVNLGNYPLSLEYLFKGLEIASNPKSEKDKWRFNMQLTPKQARLTTLAPIHLQLGYAYNADGNTRESIMHYQLAKKISEEIPDKALTSQADMTLGLGYLNLKKFDSALYYAKNASAYNSTALDYTRLYRGFTYNIIGDIYFKQKDYTTSRHYYNKAVEESEREKNYQSLASASLNLARLYNLTSHSDSGHWYAFKALEIFRSTNTLTGLRDTYNLMAEIYKSENSMDSAYYYLQLSMQTKDSLINAEKIKRFQHIGFEQQLRTRKMNEDQKALRNRYLLYAMLGLVTIFLVVALLLARNNKHKQKANILLQQQKEKVESTLSELKSTQAQLIQSEKMASLGELTAGIAHEIQNPLNFVNNFSEVSTELVDEMNEEMAKGNYDDAKEIANDVKQNLAKINHHGKRAGDIVKGMLQHSSSSSSGVKEPTDINALCDEYLRLSYHGFRAKDKSFNAAMKTDFDESIGNINIISQDIGRVVLNLINNAFYAVGERSKAGSPDQSIGIVDEKKTLRQTQGDNDYEPTVTVSTKKLNGKIEISVTDNGNGIPQKIVDKIFQPFFTTKPTGQGTGLGLSLSYDIVKAHGGELKVETLSAEDLSKAGKEGEGTEFIISIPEN